MNSRPSSPFDASPSMAPERIIAVELTDRSYTVLVGAGLLQRSDLWTRGIRAHQVLIVTSAPIAQHYLNPMLKTLERFSPEVIVIPDGEQHKTLQTLELIFDKLMQLRFDRSATLIALGGGVICDMTGFAAACYRRGIAVIHAPTTLLAQVDAAIGGKTGVNHPLGKNMIGAFYQPSMVVIDTDTLSTLPVRQLQAGLAEIIKYGLLADEPFFNWIENNLSEILGLRSQAVQKAVLTSCQIKARIVAEDETEQGIRALLNLGHTFAHAIETLTNYQSWLHGEAVGTGLVMAAHLSMLLGYISTHDYERIANLIHKAGLPTRPGLDIDPKSMLDAMKQDKKIIDGTLRLIVIERIGQAKVSSDVPLVLLETTLNTFCQTYA